MMTAQQPAESPARARFADADTLLAPYLRDALEALAGQTPLMAGMVRYHLGELNADLSPVIDGSVDRGKRVRPAVAVLCAAAAGGDPAVAGPVAAAIEMLHNFTLIHDDVQDESPTRRYRPTVWSLWGVGQAINAGDALFAAAHLPLYRLAELGVAPAVVLRLEEAFDRMTIAIVAGQTRDLSFEGRRDVTPAAYLEMIDAKTAAIVRYAAWTGALLGGASETTAERFGEFGAALGVGFQVQDDLLGIWGATETTGKAAADDLRRRKQSLPMLLLRERADTETRTELDAIYAAEAIDDASVTRLLTLLDAAKIRVEVEARVATLHDEARTALLTAAQAGPNPARDRLLALVAGLAARTG